MNPEPDKMIPYDVLLKAVQNASVGGPNYWAAAVLVVGLIAFAFLLYWLLKSHTETIKAMREDSKAQVEVLVSVVRENTTALTTFGQRLDANTSQLGEVRRSIEKCGGNH